MSNYTKGERRVYYNSTKNKHEVRIHQGKDMLGILSSFVKEGDAQLDASAPDLYEELKEADAIICELCKRLNPQHEAREGYESGCTYCQDRESRLKALAKAEDK